MSAKMNWDRVRKESQTRRSGSDWIGADAVGPTPGKQIKPSQNKKAAKIIRTSGLSRIPDCTCGKATGFVGKHKKTCLLSQRVNSRANPSLGRHPFTDCIKRAGDLLPARGFLLSLQSELRLAQNIPLGDRPGAQKLVRALLDSLDDKPAQKLEAARKPLPGG
jgi:hypothetical protein